MAKLTFVQVSQLLKYDPKSGKLFWLARSPEMFGGGEDAHIKAARWNGRFAGKEAFITTNVSGYKTGTIFAKGYSAHRIAWLLVHGDWPNAEIDHINGDKSDNRIDNLRDVNDRENHLNQKRRGNNSSGVIGVRYFSPTKRWHAYISIDGKRIPLGNYRYFDSAVAARKAAEKVLGFHPNHGSR